MTYTGAVIMEHLRNSNVPFSALRETVCDTEVQGYKVPKGMTVRLKTIKIHDSLFQLFYYFRGISYQILDAHLRSTLFSCLITFICVISGFILIV